MYVVPKIMFPFMWKKDNPPKTLHLKSKGEGVYGDLFTLTSFPSVNGIELILSYHDKENAYYEGAEGYPEFDILSDKRRAFEIIQKLRFYFKIRNEKVRGEFHH